MEFTTTTYVDVYSSTTRVDIASAKSKTSDDKEWDLRRPILLTQLPAAHMASAGDRAAPRRANAF